ncbi:hypothetical protein SAY87_009552 [Trapa incisa]|uniref:Cell division control protein 73 C-terminal domain-containing protein n=1 Tax=Trapa incisa TaxID=236973 RepID=A0AAN7Q2V4_9MYRT|nr:hypothetical protein SAY87_009552 [Trapa incisa]
MGFFIPTYVKVRHMKGPKPECATVQKKFSKDRVVAAYEVRDKPSALKPEDWDPVVDAFVMGKKWQFKDWPFRDHVEIFNKIIGFYMRFEDDSVESAKTVKHWNVKIISVRGFFSRVKLLFKIITSYTLMRISTYPNKKFECVALISKNKRYQDRTAALEVWDGLKQFIQSRLHG